MSIKQLDSKKQFLILIILIIALLGLYIYFRLVPATNDLGGLNNQLKADRVLLSNPNIPEEPLDEVEDLEDEIAELNLELEQLARQSATLGKKLPDIKNQQDVMLKVSEAARTSRVRIVNNVPYLTRKRIELKFDAATGKKLSKKQQKKYERRLRKSLKKARKKAAGTGVGVFTKEGELMDRLVNDFAVSRPLHELQVEGTYTGIKQFIEALQVLPWQITVVKIDYKVLPRAGTTQGYPQPLLVDMIIGA